MSDFHMPFVLFLSLPGLKKIIQHRAQLLMCFDNQEAVSVVLSATSTEVIKSYHGLEYKFIHLPTRSNAFPDLKTSET